MSQAQMTSRQRMLAAFNYDRPDRIPVVYHPSPAGLHVHGDKLLELLDLGVRGLWPQVAWFDADPDHLRKCRDRKVALYIHPDRQRLVPLGTTREIDDRIRDYANRHRDLGGGGIFYIEIENDAPFENVKALIEAVHRHR